MAKSKLKDKLAERQSALQSEAHTVHRDPQPEAAEKPTQKENSPLKKSASPDTPREEPRIKRIQNEGSNRVHAANQAYAQALDQQQEEKYEQELEEKSFQQFETTVVRKGNRKLLRKAVTGLLILLCAYMAFLIFGVIMTEYTYNDKNEVVPKRVSLQQISEMKEYDVLVTQYYSCRALYEQVLLLDCRYIAAETQEELIVIGTEYWKALDTVEDLIVQINALTVPSKYENIKSQMLTWTQTYIAVYCQNMSYSISNNSETDLQNALEYQQLTYNGFQIISKNLATMGAQVPGADPDVKNISDWTPSKFIQEQSGGLFK